MVDVEKNGLHGPVFAVGAVILRADGEVVQTYRARCPIEGEVRSFVSREVLPALADFEVTHKDARALRDDFWQWFVRVKDQCHVFADCGWPAEARFFIALADDTLDERYLNGPYPLHEVSTLLLACGIDPDVNREAFAGVEPEAHGRKHNPLWDAHVSGLVALKALNMLGSAHKSLPSQL